MNGTAAQEPIGKRAAHELTEFLIVAAYFYVCFTALAYLKAARTESLLLPSVSPQSRL